MVTAWFKHRLVMTLQLIEGEVAHRPLAGDISNLVLFQLERYRDEKLMHLKNQLEGIQWGC